MFVVVEVGNQISESLWSKSLVKDFLIPFEFLGVDVVTKDGVVVVRVF